MQQLSFNDLWDCLRRALRVFGRGKGPLLVATQTALALVLLPSLLQSLTRVVPGLAPLLFALGLIFVPPVLVALFRLYAADAKGTMLPPTALFAVFGDGALWRQSVWLHVLNLASMLLVIGGMLSAAIDADYLQALAAAMQNAKPGQAPSLPALPSGAGLALLLAFLAALLINAAQYLSLAHLAHTAGSAWESWTAAWRAVLRNAFVLMVFSLMATFAIGLVFMAFTLLAALPVQLLSLLSPAIGGLLMLLLYFVFVVLLSALMFAFFQALHQRLFETAPPALPSDSVAL